MGPEGRPAGYGRGWRWFHEGWNWKRAAIVASVALNLFFLGLIGAWQGRALFGPPPPGPSIPRMLAGTLRNLPDADRQLLEQVFQSRRHEIGQLAEGLRHTRGDMSRALRRPDFDPADFDAKAMAAREARSRLDAALQDVYRDAAKDMTPEGRDRLGRTRRPG
jgi:uncharacterized membrane protein